MKEINIAPHIGEVMVFDDPEFCEDKTHSCRQIENYGKNQRYCKQFDLMRMTSDRPKKCPQCRTAYAKATRSREIEKHTNIMGG